MERQLLNGWHLKGERPPTREDADEKGNIWVWDGIQSIVFPYHKLHDSPNYRMWKPRLANPKPKPPEKMK